MSLTVNCFENLSVQKLVCRCCKSQKAGSDVPTSAGATQEKSQQIVILSTPQVEFPDLVVYEDLSATDFITVTADDAQELRFVNVQGNTILKGITSYVPGYPEPHSPGKKVEMKILPPAKPLVEAKVVADLLGETLTDVMPDYMVKFFLPMFRRTLMQGLYLQLTTLWMGQTQLLRTFPIYNHKKQIISAMLVISPYNTDFNGDLTRYALEEDKLRLARAISAPSDELSTLRSTRSQSEH